MVVKKQETGLHLIADSCPSQLSSFSSKSLWWFFHCGGSWRLACWSTSGSGAGPVVHRYYHFPVTTAGPQPSEGVLLKGVAWGLSDVQTLVTDIP